MAAADTITVQQIPAGLIRAGDNDRKSWDPAGLAQLAASIKASGLAQPPTCRPMPDGTYQLVAGERRFRACTELLGWTTVPVHVRPLTDDQAAEIMLAENESRTDLNPIEQATAYQARLNRGATIAELAERCGIPRRRIESRLRLLALADDIAHLVATGNLPLGTADLISDLDHNRQHLCIAAIQTGIATDALRVMVARLMGEQQSEPLFDPASFFQVSEYIGHAVEVAATEQLGLFSAQIDALTRDRDRQIRAMRANGATLKAIGAMVGLSHPSVRAICLKGEGA